MKTNKRNLLITCCMLLAFTLAAFGMYFNNNNAHAEGDTFDLNMTLTPQGSVWGDYIFCTTTLTESYINSATWKISSTMGTVSEYFDITSTNTLLSYSHTSDGRTFFDMSDTAFTVTITEEQKNKIEHFSQWSLDFTIYCGSNIVYLGESTGTSYNRYWTLSPDDEAYYFSYTITLPGGTEPEELFYTIDFADTNLYFKEPESWRTALNFELEHVNDYIDEAVNVTLSNDGSTVTFFQGYMEYTITRINISTEGDFNADNCWYQLSITNFSFAISEYNANLINNATIDRTYFLLLAGNLVLCNAADESSNNYKLNYTITEHITEPIVTGEDYTPPPVTNDTSIIDKPIDVTATPGNQTMYYLKLPTKNMRFISQDSEWFHDNVVGGSTWYVFNRMQALTNDRTHTFLFTYNKIKVGVNNAVLLTTWNIDCKSESWQNILGYGHHTFIPKDDIEINIRSEYYTLFQNADFSDVTVTYVYQGNGLRMQANEALSLYLVSYSFDMSGATLHTREVPPDYDPIEEEGQAPDNGGIEVDPYVPKDPWYKPFLPPDWGEIFPDIADGLKRLIIVVVIVGGVVLGLWVYNKVKSK